MLMRLPCLHGMPLSFALAVYQRCCLYISSFITVNWYKMGKKAALKPGEPVLPLAYGASAPGSLERQS